MKPTFIKKLMTRTTAVCLSAVMLLGTAAGAAGTAIAAAGVGGAFRYRRFRQIIKGWTRRP